MTVQMNLFSSPMYNIPDIDNITIEWLLNYVNLFYPSFKFKILNSNFYLDDVEVIISQTISKKIYLKFYISRYDKNLIGNDNRFIGFFYGKNFGDYEGHSRGCDTIEEFLIMLKTVTRICDKYLSDYKERNE